MHEGVLIRKLRDDAGLEQPDLARPLNVSQSHFSRVEAGQRQLTEAQWQVVAPLLAGERPRGSEDEDPVWVMFACEPGDALQVLPDELGRVGLFADRPLAMAAVAPLRDRFGPRVWAVPRWAAHAAVLALRHMDLEDGPAEPVVLLTPQLDVVETGKAIAEHVGSVIRRLTAQARNPVAAP